ncbi:MAG: winged helix-turn-helix domain-containing protein [Rhodomicrobiaceae bacterium]
MDAYLKIARKVLHQARRPMSAKSILRVAYRVGMVPLHLHGKTQHKTLQARLSEDIVSRRDRSAFFRTKPGCFFLREFLNDASLPEEFRSPFPARRRSRDFITGKVLTVATQDLDSCSIAKNDELDPKAGLRILSSFYTWTDYKKDFNEDIVCIIAFAIVVKGGKVLTHRIGRYRDDRDPFLLRRTIGFPATIKQNDLSLFNYTDLAISECGTKAAINDLDIPTDTPESVRLLDDAVIERFVLVKRPNKIKELLGIVIVKCPMWFEPTRRRLAIQNLDWLDPSVPVNNIEDFDPWSQSVLKKYNFLTKLIGSCEENEENHRSEIHGFSEDST